MAELGTALAPPTARQQFSAIVRLRLRLFLNVFRRKSDAKIAAVIFGYLMLALITVGVLGSFSFMFGLGSYEAVHRGHADGLALEFWSIFLLWQFFSINASSITAAQRFDPATLIRFPLTYPRFLAVTFISSAMTFGVLVACILFTAIGTGIIMADSSLALRALLALVCFGLFNLLLSRALQVWVSRWISTRLAREIFSFASILLVVGTQLIRFRFFRNPILQSYGTILNGPLHPVLVLFPPALVTRFILEGSLLALIALLLCIAFAFALYSWRVRKQFYGEDLNESPAPKPVRTKSAPAIAVPAGVSGTKSVSALSASLRKEWIGMRRNTALIYNGLMPLIFVVIFSMQGRLFSNHVDYFLPGAVSYALLNLLATGYNIFGTEGTGIQFYLFAPTGLREAVLAKNIVTLTFLLIDSVLAIAIVSSQAHANVSSLTLATTGVWVIFMIFINLAVGMLRSVYSPTKVDLTKLSIGRRSQTGRGASGFIVLGMTFGNIMICVGIIALCRYLGHPELPVLLFALLAAGAIGLYVFVLGRIEKTIYSRSERLMDVLCRT